MLKKKHPKINQIILHVSSGRMASTQADLEFKYQWAIFGSVCDSHQPGLGWCILTHSSLCATKTKHHSLYVSGLTTGSRISLLIPPPFTLPFWDSLIKWERWLILALNSPCSHCSIICPQTDVFNRNLVGPGQHFLLSQPLPIVALWVMLECPWTFLH